MITTKSHQKIINSVQRAPKSIGVQAANPLVPGAAKPVIQANPPQNQVQLNRGFFSRFFRGIALFFVRLGLFFQHREWFSERKVKQMISETKNPKPTDNVSQHTPQIEKIIHVVNKLSRFKDLDHEEEEIRSLIDEKKPIFNLLDKMSIAENRLLFQIQADEFGVNNEKLEGYNKKETLKYLDEYFNARKSAKLDLYGLSEDVIEEVSVAAKIANADTLDSFIQLTSEAIQKISKHPILLPGGWIGTPSGHAMYYEIIPQENGKAIFRLFNLGAGAMGATDPSDYKTKAAPYIDFEGVSLKTLADKHTLQAIYELNTQAFFPNSKTKTQFNQEDIYQSLKSLLKPDSISQPKGTLKTMQRAGVCTWRSLMAFLSSRMPKEEYKRFACDINMQSLIHRDWKNITNQSEFKVLQKSHEKVARKLNKMAKEKLIGMHYLAQANEFLGITSNHLKDYKIKAYKSSLRSTNNSSWSSSQVNFPNSSFKPLHVQTQEPHQENAPPLNTAHIESIHLYPLSKAISETRKIIEKREFHTAHIALQRYITNLDLQALDKKNLEELSQQLGELAKLYFDTCFLIPEAEAVLPERVITLEKMLSLQSEVAKLIEPKSEEFLFYTNQNAFLFTPNDNQEGFVTQKRTFGEQGGGSNGCIPYGQSIDKKPGIFEFKFFDFSNLNKLFPNHEELMASDPEYYKLVHHAQMAKLYMSDQTPSWFQTLRNTSLFLHYIAAEPVANPTNASINSFNLDFKFKPGADNSSVVVSLNELSDDMVKKSPMQSNGKRFASSHRNFASAKMKQFIDFIVEKNRWLEFYHAFRLDEKKLLELENNTEFDEEFKNLAHVFTNNNKVNEGIEYFYRHPEKLADPDYQILFEIFIFNGDYLKDELKKSGFSTLLNNFLKEQIKYSLATNEIQKSTFLIRMSSLINLYDQRVETQTDLLQNLLNRSQLDSTEKSVIYAESVALLGKKENLTPKELEDLVVWSTFLQENPVPQKWMIPQQNNEIREALVIHNNRILEVLKNDKDGKILNRTAKEVYGIEGVEPWKVVENGPSIWFQSHDKKISYHPTHAKMMAENYNVSLPLEIAQHSHFIKNFKGISTAIHGSNNVYSFTYEGKKILVKIIEGQLLIEQQRNGNWYRFLPEDTFIKPGYNPRQTHLGSRHLLQNYSHWQNLEDPTQLVLIDNKTNQPAFQATLNGNALTKISKVGSAQVLMAPSSLLTRFEDHTYIQEWGDGSKVGQIELPRFGLTFSPDAKEPKQWNCDQFSKEGFFIAQEQSLPVMGAYQDYLVLENAAGKKKVLLPEYKIKSPEKEKNSIVPEFIVDRNLDNGNREPQKYSAFDENKKGFLESKSASAKHHLGMVLSAVQEYDSAAHYLKHGVKLTRYTEKEQESLNSIAEMSNIIGDQSGNGLALQTYAIYLLTRNALEHDVEAKEVYSEEHVETYKKYLAHLNHATALKLTREEEMFLLKFFLNNTYDPTLHVRLQKLDPKFAKTIEIKEEPKEIHLPTNSFLKLPLPNTLSKDIPPFAGMLLTRINIYIGMNPIKLFEMIKNATEEQKKWLKEAFTFGKRTMGAHWSFVFEDILNHPEQYPSPYLGNERLKQLYWWDKVIAIAEKNTAQERKQIAEEVNPLKKPEILPKEAIETKSPDKAFKVELKKIKEVPGFSERCKPYFNIKCSKNVSKNYEEWLAHELAHPTSSEPLYANELKRLQTDMSFKKEKIEYSIKKLGPIQKITKLLNREKNQEKLKCLELELMTLANRPSDSYFDQLVEMVQLRGNKRKALTLDDLIIYFAKNDPASLIQMNPHLKPVVDELFKKIQIYLILSTREQQRTRALQTISKLEKAKGADKQEFEQQLGADLLAARAYNAHEHPEYLAFEFYANLLMRDQQVDKLKAFMEGGDDSLVMEMIMGSGKSKVLLPLLGLLRANGKKLSLVIVPEPLFGSVSSDTQCVLSEAFGQSLKSLHFHRNTQFDKYTLQRIKDDLHEIRDRKECLIMTSKSIQCFLLKFVEESTKQKGVMTDELLLMRDILIMIAESNPLIDEVDTVLNVLHEVSFTTGLAVKPRDNEIKLIAQMYNLLYTDPVISKRVHIESNPNASRAEEELSEKNYHKQVKPLLAEKLLHDFDDHEKILAKNYLLREDVPKKDQAEAHAYYSKLDPAKQNYLALAAEQLNNFLPHTLTKTCEEKYGLDLKGGGSIAIPYAAANVPNVGSQFANPYITMNYTFQYHVKKGIQREILIKEIERLQSMAMLEMKEKGAGCSLETTEAWKLFKEITGDLNTPLFNFNEKQIHQLLEKINSQVELKTNFIQKAILPQLMLSEKKLSCNPQNLIAFFLSINGFTGTLWNQFSMHSKIKSMPDPGIDSKTLNILWNNSNEKVEVINGTSPTEMINELIGKGIQFDLISDSGGYLKEGGNAQIALQLSQITGKPMVFYNKDNQQAIIENGKEVLLAESTTPIDKRCTFLDQSHTTGSDVAYKHDAIGLVTISRNMLFRDLLQSVWRLRGLDKSQKVKFIISKEVQGIICQVLGKEKESEISLGDILRFTIINQTKQQGIDNFKGLRQEMHSHIQQLLFKVMLSPDYSEKQRKDTIEALEEFWIKNTNQEPKDLFGDLAVEQESSIVIPNELKKYKKTIKKLKVKLPHFVDELNPMQKMVEEHAEKLKGLLPNKLITPIRDLDHDQTTEVMDETEQETQTELEVNNNSQTEKIKMGFVSSSILSYTNELTNEIFESRRNYSFGINTYFNLDADLKDYSQAFSGIQLTLNMLQWNEENPKVADLKLFGSRMTPIHQIEFEFANDEVLLRSNYDKVSYENPKVYNLGFGFYDRNKKLTPEQQKLVVKIKFLNGESSYSKEEKEILEQWIKENDAAKMYKLLQNHILVGSPAKVTEYNSDSVLKKVFTSLHAC